MKPFRAMETDHVWVGECVLPAKHLRLCGPEFCDDQYYVRSAQREADRLVNDFGLTANTCLLDIGCGFGRLAAGILSRIGDIRLYYGLDVSRKCIDWCRRHIHSSHDSFRFAHLDVKNDRYNPTGEDIGASFRLPFSPSLFEIGYLYSVLSHLLPEDAVVYCSEFRRILTPGGRVLITGFVEEHVPDVSVNPEGYRMNWSGPLHCVRYRKDFLVELFATAGFRLDCFEYATETDGQSAMHLSLVS